METADSAVISLLTPLVSQNDLLDGTTQKNNLQFKTATNAVTSPTPISQIEQSQDDAVDSDKKLN